MWNISETAILFSLNDSLFLGSRMAVESWSEPVGSSSTKAGDVTESKRVRRKCLIVLSLVRTSFPLRAGSHTHTESVMSMNCDKLKAYCTPNPDFASPAFLVASSSSVAFTSTTGSDVTQSTVLVLGRQSIPSRE